MHTLIEPRLVHGVMTPAFAIEEVAMPANLRMRGHGHDEPHLCMVMDGAFHEANHLMANGLMRVSPAGDTHDIEFSNVGALCLVLTMNATLLDTVPYPRDRRFLNQRSIHVAGRQLRAALASSVTVVRLELIVLELLASACLPQPMQKRGDAPLWLKQVRAALDDQPLTPPSTEILAHAAGLHPVYVARLFRTWFGCSLSDYSRLLRLDEALRMIVHSSESLAAIAAKAGYADQSHLTRAVRIRTGFTPGALRRGKVASVPDFRLRAG